MGPIEANVPLSPESITGSRTSIRQALEFECGAPQDSGSPTVDSRRGTLEAVVSRADVRLYRDVPTSTCMKLPWALILFTRILVPVTGVITLPIGLAAS